MDSQGFSQNEVELLLKGLRVLLSEKLKIIVLKIS